MELPHIGEHCALKQCNRLDFLPIKCDSCSGVFCIKHYKYDDHNCEKAKSKSVHQLPVCPLCSRPVVSSRPDQLPDIAVSQHIDQDCSKNELIAHRRKAQQKSLQSCSLSTCKQKDLIYLECTDCQQKYCIKHRHPSDHSCSGPPATSVGANLANNWNQFKGSCSTSATNNYELIKNKVHQMSRSGQAALNRLAAKTSGGGSSSGPSGSTNSVQSNNPAVHSLQGNLSEQEALAIAMNESRGAASGHQLEAHDEDAALARALHESQLEAARRQRAGASNQKDNCVLS